MGGSTISNEDVIPGFKRFARGIWYFDPRLQESKPSASGEYNTLNDDDPRVILIFAWLSVRAVHLQEYLDTYKTQYPNAFILVARSGPSIFWALPRAREAYVLPILAALERYQGSFFDNPPPMLIHIFSNGGSYLASELARTISERELGSTPQNGLPASCIIFDSCPSCADVGVAVRGFTAVIKSRILKVVAGFLFYVGLFVLIIMRVLLRQEHLIHAMRARLNEASVFPWTSNATPRLYVYSDADDMVPADVVEEHIADARQKGRIVHVEKYHSSLHVSHADMDPERYWGAVQSLWLEAVRLSRENN